MILGLYREFTTLAAPALLILLARRAARGKEIAARLPERRGVDATPRPAGRLLWLHAASVGETVSMLPVLAALPGDVAVLMTTGTVTSAALLDRRLPELGLDGRVIHRFVPLDVPRWVARFLDHWRPDAGALVESEIWPNLITACATRGIPLALVNARLSPRSAAKWARLPGLARTLLGGFDRVFAQSDADAARLHALGAPASSLTGNLKYAAPPLPADPVELARLGGLLAGRPVWLAASTHPGEDATVRAVHERLAPRYPGLLTIIVPRHPERGPEVAAAMAGLAVTRRAAGEDPPSGSGVYVADTLGELGLFYRLAPIAFVGRSLGAAGGQNPLEPARLGAAVAVGPAVHNFADIVPALVAAGAVTQVKDIDALGDFVAGMLDDPAARAAMGTAGRAASAALADLPERVAAALVGMIGGG
ncbi:MAG: 3-deoxy-D-manno-octulosonic acid transferase [Alphaproteobacteria bacterium]|nr:3-deoxy-D-manno-octulosonic acid transferase [Alphaproteobacteria bacterium]